MCFSAEASFTAGTLLSVVGIATVKNNLKKPLFFIALMPLLFAVQQFAEGIVWLFMNESLICTTFSISAQYTFLVFAWVIWPLFIPIALMVPETKRWKRYIMLMCFFICVGIAFLNLKFLLTTEVVAEVHGQNLYYSASTFYDKLIYAFATILPALISSIKKMWIVGIFLIIAYVVSNVVYNQTFTSVWCFFVAIISLTLYFVLRSKNRFDKA